MKHPIFKKARKKKAAKRRKRLAIYAGAAAAAALILTGAFAWGSGHPRVSISDIHIIGNELIASENVAETIENEIEGRYFALFAKDNIFLYPDAAVRERILSAFPRIASIDIARDSLTALTVTLSERKPAYLFCSSGELEHEGACSFADKNGFIFARAPQFSGDAYVRIFNDSKERARTVGVFATENKELFAHARALQALLVEREIPIRNIRIKKHQEYTFILDSGIELRFNMTESPERFADNVDSVLQEVSLASNIDYIDFRFGNKVFFK